MLLLQIQQTELIQFNDLHFKGVGDYTLTPFCCYKKDNGMLINTLLLFIVQYVL